MNCQLAAGTAAVVGMQDDQGARLLSASCRTVNSGTAIVCATTSRRLHVLRLAVQPIAAAGTSLLTLYPLLPPPLPSVPIATESAVYPPRAERRRDATPSDAGDELSSDQSTPASCMSGEDPGDFCMGTATDALRVRRQLWGCRAAGSSVCRCCMKHPCPTTLALRYHPLIMLPPPTCTMTGPMHSQSAS